MGLLLSILVTCVGVLEVIACVRHFQYGYLPLWTPHLVSSATTNLYEHWRTIPNYYCHRHEVFADHANNIANEIGAANTCDEIRNEFSDDSALEYCEENSCENNAISHYRNDDYDISVQNTTYVSETSDNSEQSVKKGDAFGVNNSYIENSSCSYIRSNSSFTSPDTEAGTQKTQYPVSSYLAKELADTVESSDDNIFLEVSIIKNYTPSQFSINNTFLNSSLQDSVSDENKNQEVSEKIQEIINESLTKNEENVISDLQVHLPSTTKTKEIELQPENYQDIPEKVNEAVNHSLSQNDTFSDNAYFSLASESKEIGFLSKKYQNIPEKQDEAVDQLLAQNRVDNYFRNFHNDNINFSLTSETKEIEYLPEKRHNVPEIANEAVSQLLSLQNESETCVQNFHSGNINFSITSESNENEFPPENDQDTEKEDETVKHSLSQNESETLAQNSSSAVINFSLTSVSKEIGIPPEICQDVPEKADKTVKQLSSQNGSDYFVRNLNFDNANLILTTESKEIDFLPEKDQDVPERAGEAVNHSLPEQESNICVLNSLLDNIDLFSTLESKKNELPAKKCQDSLETDDVNQLSTQNRSDICVPNFSSDNVQLCLTTQCTETGLSLNKCQDVSKETDEAVSFSSSENGTCVRNPITGDVLLSLRTECKEIECPSEIQTCYVEKVQTRNENEQPAMPNENSVLFSNDQLVFSASDIYNHQILPATDDCSDQLVYSASDEPLLYFQTNEFSKKEMALKRRRSYKSKKNNANTIDGRKLKISATANNALEERHCALYDNESTSSEIDSIHSLSEITQNTVNVDADMPLLTPEHKSFETTNNVQLIDKSSKSLSQDKKDNKLCENTSVCVSFSQETDDEHAGKFSETEERSKLEAPKEAFWLIFSGEYTKALSKDWHSGHFCCWQCDESLTGQRYVLRDEHPYCIKCYESVFANVCEECNKIIGIDSKDLSYKDKHWHEACFLCNKCHVSLVDKQFGSKADKIYCGNCYDTQFASRCDGCGDIFRAGTKKMEYKTRQWHEKCFCCCVCKTAIGTKSFIPREQEIYCATCYEEKFATRCVKCNKIITSGGVTYKNEPWHRECFTCTHCNTSLAGQRFTSRDEKPYCAECFGELFAKRCTSCSKPITGIGGTRFISFEDRHWHNDCFICASCKTSLVGRGFITDGDDIICPECAKQKLM